MPPTRRHAAPALVLAAALALGACSDDGDTTGDPAATTSAPPATGDEPATTVGGGATTTTEAAGEPTTTAGGDGEGAPAIPTNAEDYATAFVEAWAVGDVETVELLGTEAAAESILALEGGGVWTLARCEGAAGSSYCTFTAGGDPAIVVRVQNEAAGQGRPHAVTEAGQA